MSSIDDLIDIITNTTPKMKNITKTVLNKVIRLPGLFAGANVKIRELITTNTDYINEKIIFNLINKENINKDEIMILSQLPLNDFLIAFSSLEINGYIQEEFGEVRRIV